MNTQDEAKILAGQYAVENFIHEGMTVGLGSGTTAHFFVRSLGEKVKNGLKITAAAASRSTIEVAEQAGITITDINDIGVIDVTIDGLDEMDSSCRMIKGGGGALLWEKILAHASQQMIAICDETKIVTRLGAYPLPVEVVQFGSTQTVRLIKALLDDFSMTDTQIILRHHDGKPVVTDSGNVIFDCHCRSIAQPERLERELNRIPGVVENGLFTTQADGVCVGCFDGMVDMKMRDTH